MTQATEDVRTSQLRKGLRQELIDNQANKDYRHAYADESLNISIATQLKVLREQRGWTQQELADGAEMRQSMISRYENVNYSSWSINTLKKLAVAFDVWLDVRFRSFGELVTTVEGFNRDSLQVPSFDNDGFFRETPGLIVQNPVPRFGLIMWTTSYRESPGTFLHPVLLSQFKTIGIKDPIRAKVMGIEFKKAA